MHRKAEKEAASRANGADGKSARRRLGAGICSEFPARDTRRMMLRTRGAVCKGHYDGLRWSSHSHARRPVLASWVRSMTPMRSRLLWYWAYGVLPSRTAGSPAFSNDQWSLLRLSEHRRTGMPIRRAAAATALATASVPTPPVQIGTRVPTPTRSGLSIPARDFFAVALMALT